MPEMSTVEGHKSVPEARYAYYRRCRVFKRNGVQCKAPAETGSQICHAHAGQLSTAVRRERDRRAVLAEAVAEMRKRGRPDCEMANLFTDFKGIQVTTAVMARAVITGRIDCKTAGQMVVHLQTLSKLLRQIHRRKTSTTEARRHGELWKSYPGPSFAVKAPLIQDDSLKRGEFAPRSFITPQICAVERRLKTKNLPLISTDNTDLKKLPNPKPLPRMNTDDTDLTTESRRHGELWKSYPGPSFAVKAPLIQDDSLKRGEFAQRCFITPQRCADERRLKTKNLPLINTDNTDLKKLPNPGTLPRINADGADRKKSHVGKNFNVTFSKHRPLALLDGGSRILPFKLSAFGDRCRAHGPPEANAA